VHTAALHLVPILGAEKSKAPFYIAGGLLVAWALIVSIGLGMRNPDFPGSLGGQRIVAAITAVLVAAAAATAVITSGSPAPSGEKSASSTQGATQETGGATAPAQSTPSAPTTTTGTSPKATTGTPAPASSPAAATTLKLVANPAGQLAYETKQLSAKAGKVTIDFSNSSPVEHDVAIAQGSAVAGQTPVFTGGTKALTLTLKPGKYTFYCTVPGHRQAGMEGTLTVS
jgi:plastocyanin